MNNFYEYVITRGTTSYPPTRGFVLAGSEQEAEKLVRENYVNYIGEVHITIRKTRVVEIGALQY